MSAIPDEEDDAEVSIPIPPPPADFAAFRKWTISQVGALHKSDQRQWKWIWIVTGAVGLGAYLLGQSGLIQRLFGGGQ